MNLSEIWSAVSNRIGNLNSDTAADQARMTTWANQAVVDLLLRTRCYVTSSTASLSAGVKDYTLDSNILTATNVYVSGASEPLMRVTPEELLNLRMGNQTVSSSMQYYAVNGSNMLMVYPTPSANDVLMVYYVPRPSAMSVSSHDPSNATYGGIPSQYHKAIEYFVCAEAADDDDDASSAQGQRYRELYEREILRVRNYSRRKLGPFQPRFRTAMSGRRFRPHDPSTDWR